MKERPVTDRRRVSMTLWVAGAALVAVVALVVVVIQAHVSDTVIAGVAAAAVTGAVSIVLAIISLQDRQREADERRDLQRQAEEERARSRHEEHVLRALDYFTGQTQRRNVGIAIVEGYWHATPSLHGVLVPLLVNQAIYLLEQSREEDAPHEADNCYRIVDLLLSGYTSSNLDSYYKALLDAVMRRSAQKGAFGTGRRGVDVKQETLEQWATALQAKLSGIDEAT